MDRLLAGPALVVGRQLAADRLLAGPALVVGIQSSADRYLAGPALVVGRREALTSGLNLSLNLFQT